MSGAEALMGDASSGYGAGDRNQCVGPQRM